MTRKQAGDRFGATWGLGVLWSLLTQALEVPTPLRFGVGAVVLILLVYYGTTWLRMAVRDGTLRSGLPDYGWAFVSLLIIAAIWAVITLPILLVLGEEVTATALSSGALPGVFVTLVAWWVLKGRRAPAAER